MPRDGAEIIETPAAALPRQAALGLPEYGLIALQAMLWGSTFFFVAITRPFLPPMSLSALRLLPAVALLLVVVAALGLRLPATVPEWRRVLMFSILNNVVPFALITLALREMTGGIAAIFMAAAPLSALILAPWFIADERFTWCRFAGIVMGIGGVAVLAGVSGTENGSGTWRGQGMLLLATVSFSGANIYARKFMGGYHPFALASAQTIGSLILVLPLALLIDRPWQIANPPGYVWLAALAMGTLGSALAPLCHFTVLKRSGAVNAMLSSIVVPVTPVLLGWAFLGETLTLGELLGGVIIALSLVVIDGRAVTWAHRRATSFGTGL